MSGSPSTSPSDDPLQRMRAVSQDIRGALHAGVRIDWMNEKQIDRSPELIASDAWSTILAQAQHFAADSTQPSSIRQRWNNWLGQTDRIPRRYAAAMMAAYQLSQDDQDDSNHQQEAYAALILESLEYNGGSPKQWRSETSENDSDRFFAQPVQRTRWSLDGATIYLLTLLGIAYVGLWTLAIWATPAIDVIRADLALRPIIRPGGIDGRPSATITPMTPWLRAGLWIFPLVLALPTAASVFRWSGRTLPWKDDPSRGRFWQLRYRLIQAWFSSHHRRVLPVLGQAWMNELLGCPSTAFPSATPRKSARFPNGELSREEAMHDERRYRTLQRHDQLSRRRGTSRRRAVLTIGVGGGLIVLAYTLTLFLPLTDLLKQISGLVLSGDRP